MHLHTFNQLLHKNSFWKRERFFLSSSFAQDLHSLRQQQSGSVNVEMDCAGQSNIDKELQEMRAQYEMLIEKNRREAEKWFQSKVSQYDKFTFKKTICQA